MSQDVIELNGKRYDAITGAFLGKSHVVPQHLLVPHKSTDGFMRPSHPTARAPKHTTPLAVPAPSPSSAPRQIDGVVAPRHAHTRNTTANSKAHHPQQRAQTLMRRSVHKPTASLKPAIKVQAPAEVMARPSSALMRKHSVASVDPQRHQRALQTAQHHAIRHFQPTHGTVVTHSVTTHVPVITVQPAPLPITHTPRPAATHADIFEAAIARATSHQQPRPHVARHRKRSRRLLNGLAIVAVFVVLGGFIGYLNLPHVQLKVASVQAGFQASIPGFAPTGYALEKGVNRQGGIISVSFRSGDSRYTLTQQASNWNSQTLLDNTLALSAPHQTIQKNGQTIYVYGNGANAAWVNAGVRYDITGNAQLQASDIAAIAASL